MRRLLLFRHAKSSRPKGVEDHERPLSPRGQKDSSAMGHFLAKQKLRPDLVVVSTSRRTRETWKRASPAFDADIPRTDDERIYKASPAILLEMIRETSPSVHALMLVGHNPEFQELSEMLIGKGKPSARSRLDEKYPTAGLVVISFDVKDWADVSPGSGKLKRFDTPKSIN
jgi:phosphohistidine phosphatase